jgi:hypothetical protein
MTMKYLHIHDIHASICVRMLPSLDRPVMPLNTPAITWSSKGGGETIRAQGEQFPRAILVEESNLFTQSVIPSDIDVGWIELKSQAKGFQNGLFPGPYLEERLGLSISRQPRDNLLLARGEKDLRYVPPSTCPIYLFDVNTNLTATRDREYREPF